MIRYVLFAWLFIFAAILAPAFAQAQIFRRGGCFNGHCAPVHHSKEIVREVIQAPDTIQTFVFNNISPPGDLAPRGQTVYGVSRALEYNSPNSALYLDNTRRALEVASEFTSAARGLDGEILQAASIDARGRAVEAAFRALSTETLQSRSTSYRVTLKNGLPVIDELPQEPAPGRLALTAGTGCAKCHTGDGEGAKKFSLDRPLTLEDFARGEAAINSGAMPPKSNLSKIEKSMEVLKLSRLVVE